MRLFSSSCATAIAVVLGSCGTDAPPPPLADTTQEVVGFEGTFEFAIDAPARLEPIKNGTQLTYPPLPIQISFFDEYVWDRDTDDSQGKRLGDFCALEVSRLHDSAPPQIYFFTHLADVERTGRTPNDGNFAFWPSPDEVGGEPPWRMACRPNAGENCVIGMQKIRNTSEWHARVDHPLVASSGDAVTLKLEAKVSAVPGECFVAGAKIITFRNYVRVELGRDPLPRFSVNGVPDGRWLYADLHYHSQGTDNEGEVGFNFRGVMAAQAAMGLDVVFASDHASSSTQIIDADIFEDFTFGVETRQGARDMNPMRFQQLRDDFIEGPDGVNSISGAIWNHRRPVWPRVFLGGEVDVIPVVDRRPYLGRSLLWPEEEWFVPYGNGLSFDLGKFCEGWVWVAALGSCPALLGSPDPLFEAITDADGATAWRVHDVQGKNSFDFYGRQHIIYLPRTADAATLADGFVPSGTSDYGGATRTLGEVADEIAQKGIGFLAHPMSGTGEGVGPGMMPYSVYQLKEAFAHPAIVGLQLWNENSRLAAGPHGCPVPTAPDPELVEEYQRCEANEWKSEGYDHIDTGIPPSDGTGHAPGWYYGEFELVPVYDLDNWLWEREEHGLDHALHHGAYTWDRMLRWGLDLGRTHDLSWLAADEPRKVFMAGGSDAHGDFNYRRTGAMTGPSGTNTTTMGSVRNLVFADEPLDRACVFGGECSAPSPSDQALPHTQEQTVQALADGHFAITDGPALRIAVDRNNSGVVDDGDLIMGDRVFLDDSELARLPLLVQWESTPELGSVERIDLYVGVDRPVSAAPGAGASPDLDERRARTFAPANHGVRRELSELTEEEQATIAPDPSAAACPAGTTCQMADGYWMPAASSHRNALMVKPINLGMPMAGTIKRVLDLRPYRVEGGLIGTRFYVRAFARTKPTATQCAAGTPDVLREIATLQGKCISRYAFTNPIWVVQRELGGATCPYEPDSLDQDLDGLPDLCDANPTVSNVGGWSVRGGGAGVDEGSVVAQAGDGDVFIGGVFRATATLGGYGATLAASGDLPDAFVARYHSDAPTAAIWLLQLGGTGSVAVRDLSVAADGDLLVAGWFNGQLTIGSTITFTGNGDDGFIARLNGTTGAVRWARQLGGSGRQALDSATVDSTGNVLVAGTYRTEVKFMPTAVRLAGGTTDDCFAAWFNNNGNVFMARPVAGSGTCAARSIAAGPNGAVYLAGIFGGEAIFDPWGNPAATTVVSADGTDGFIVAFASTAYGWYAYLGGNGTVAPGDALVGGLAVDPSGDVVVVGSFNGTLRLAGPSGAPATATASTWDGFLARFTSGGAPVASSVRTFGGSGSEMIASIDLDTTGIAVSGVFSSPTWALGSTTLTLTGTSEGWAARLALDGSVAWTREIGFAGNSLVSAVDLSPEGWVALAASFSSQVRLDDQYVLVTTGSQDAAWARLDATP